MPVLFRIPSRLVFTLLSCSTVVSYARFQPVYCDFSHSNYSSNKPLDVKNWIWGSRHNWNSQLNEISLRHVILQEKFAVCVDCKGDVYVCTSRDPPRLLLSGQNIERTQATPTKIFALSKSGKLFCLPVATPESVSPQSFPSYRWPWSSTPIPSYVVQLHTDSPLSWTEKITSISAGNHHVLCLSNHGRAFAHPVDDRANTFGQLALSQVRSHHASPSTLIDLPPSAPSSEQQPRVEGYDPKWRQSPIKVQIEMDDQTKNALNSSSMLYEIPALRGIAVDKIVAGGRSSFALTKSHRILGWGANDHGQIGLGDNITLGAITTPTEIVASHYLPKASSQVKCLDVAAAGDLTAFTVEYVTGQGIPTYEVLMCGDGRWGGLGNNSITTFQSTPSKVRNISGLQEYNEKFHRKTPILPKVVIPSSTGHVAGILNTNDVFVWGKNHSGELGPATTSQKKTSNTTVNLPTPAQSPIQDDRIILQTTVIPQLKDMQGNIHRKNVKVTQKVALGPSQTVIYWAPE